MRRVKSSRGPLDRKPARPGAPETGLLAAPRLATAVLTRRTLLDPDEDARVTALPPDQAVAVLATPPDRLAALWDRTGLADALDGIDLAPDSEAWIAVEAALGIADIPRRVDALLDATTRDPKGRLGPTASSASLASWVAACAGPPRGTVTDLAVGEGRFLATLADRDPTAAARLLGLDTSAAALATAATRLLVRGRDADLVQRSALTGQAMATLAGSADLIVVDPPTGPLTARQREATKADPTPYGRVPVDDQAYLWIATAVAMLAPGGRAVVVTPLRTLERPGRAGTFRAAIATAGHVLAVVTLPRGMRPGAAPALALWVLQQPAHPGPVLVIDGARVNDQHATATDDDRCAARGALDTVGAHIDTVASTRAEGAGAADRLAAVVGDGFSLVTDITPDDPLVPWASHHTWTPTPPHTTIDREPVPATVPVAAPPGSGRASLIERVRHARDSLSDVLDLAERIQAGQVPGIRYQPLAELIADGVVHAYLPALTDQGWVPSTLQLTPARASRHNVPDQHTQQTPGDVIAYPTDHGADSYLASGAARMHAGPVVALRPDPTDGRVTPHALQIAIRAATIHGWPRDSRGPLPLTKAWNVIAVPILDPHDANTPDYLTALTAHADLDGLPEALTDPRLLGGHVLQEPAEEQR